MKKNKLKFILLVILIPLLTYCGGVRDALEGKKRSEQSDEFLVKKKNPLQMPPDINKLPQPGDNLEVKSQTNDDDRYLALGLHFSHQIMKQGSADVKTRKKNRRKRS